MKNSQKITLVFLLNGGTCYLFQADHPNTRYKCNSAMYMYSRVAFPLCCIIYEQHLTANEYLTYLQNNTKSRACGAIFNDNDLVVSCKECQTDPTSYALHCKHFVHHPQTHSFIRWLACAVLFVCLVFKQAIIKITTTRYTEQVACLASL
jgi:hypothetical protein